jgi:hypothetical protein
MSNSAPPSDNSLEQKVFGVGMQRTGTTSMTRALQVLGYNSAHFPAELWNNESAPVLHRRDAFFDNPIPLLYQHLDRQCPGSKFILTIRDEDSWLDSCKFLFTEKREEYGFDESARIQEMHHALYGQNHFSEEVFREVYRSHNREVKEYFSDRPDDLLILDIAQDDKWKPICSFLGVEPPDEPFPHSHSSRFMDQILGEVRKTLGSWYRTLRT